MNNPIKSFEQIHQDFALYMRTAYGTKYDSVEAERRALFDAPFDANSQSFHRLPWLEALAAAKVPSLDCYSDFTMLIVEASHFLVPMCASFGCKA